MRCAKRLVTSGRVWLLATPSGSALRVPEAKRGRVPCDGAEEVCRPQPHETDSAEPAKDGEGDNPLPLQFVIPVSRTQALRLLNQGRVFYLRGRGAVSSVVTLETRSGASVTKQAWRSQQKMEKATAPSPSSSLYRYRAPKPAPTEPRSSVLPTRRRDGVLRRDIGDAERGERVFRKRPQGARSEARAGPL